MHYNINNNNTKMTDHTYNTSELLDRLYSKLEECGKSKITLTKLIVECKNRKTFIRNFSTVCQKLNRSPEAVKAFMVSEVQKDASISADGCLVISGAMFRQPQIEKVFISYLTKYVQCTSCGSGNTEYIKKDRLVYLKCNRCMSEKSIDLKNI
jgi:translation initiation factor 2 subunit 2